MKRIVHAGSLPGYITAFIILAASCSGGNSEGTRGIGIYPGDPAEDFSPQLKPAGDQYRNLALRRAATHSSSYDYNLTAQLVTDGIISTAPPSYVSLETNHGSVPKNEREWVFDHVTGSALALEGSEVWIELEIGGSHVPVVDRIEVNGQFTCDEGRAKGWKFLLKGSSDGSSWVLLDQKSGKGLPGFERPNPLEEMMKNLPKDSTGRPINPLADFFTAPDPDEPKPSFTFRSGPRAPQRALAEVFELKDPVSYRFYRLELNAPPASSWEVGDLDLFNLGSPVEMAPSHQFTSAWMSAGNVGEWVTVDLGASSTFDRVKLYWIDWSAPGTIQVSDDNSSWTDVTEVPESGGQVVEIALEKACTGRYVRLILDDSEDESRFILSEIEVMGSGGVVPVPRSGPVATADRMNLAGGSWKIQRASQVSSTGAEISMAGFPDGEWVPATVPGTVLSSYRNAGALPDPDFGDNQLMVSESFFYSDFWYRNEFQLPADFEGKRVFLNFDGINWKAEIFLNGVAAGTINGAFIRGKFDVTGLLIHGGPNALAVLIKKNDNPGTVKEQTALSPDRNGGILGGDNPTFHASAGWDWIPTIRGRNIGIWNDVHLSATGGVTLENPFVWADLPLPDTTAADIHIEVALRNHTAGEVRGTLTGHFGEIRFEQEVTLAPEATSVIKLDPSNHPLLHLENPVLWWPNGYGTPFLHEVELAFADSHGNLSDVKQFTSGIREMSFSEEGNILSIFINGRRFIGRGGNWGFPESNLNYRGREYDIAVSYHADMNFTMIRNWVGQTGDDEFYEACDRYGIMVWQDFWLANPADGPDPNDPDMFMNNAGDLVRRIRNHPSVAIYVGRNEGFPPPRLDTALRTLISEVHPGIHYISNSSMGVVSGGGPYRALPPRDYYLLYGRNKLHSERGMPNVMTYESLEQTLPAAALWPQNSQWGLHDYCLEGAQGAASFNAMIENGFGPVHDAKTFTELAQWINYDGYRGMFEGRSRYRKGLLLWMSHPAWPSMVWQTYDYYFEPTAAYFGCKKACEPLHIQWNPVYDSVEVVNYYAGNLAGLTAFAQLINMDGTVQWEKEAGLDSGDDSTVKPFKLDFPESLSATHFIKLLLKKGDRLLSENFYWRGIEPGNYQALNTLPEVPVETKTTVKREGERWILGTTLKNDSGVPALMIRLKIVDVKTGERILPAVYSDNYVALMPGESRTIDMSVRMEDCRGSKPAVKVSGFNVSNGLQ
jgi:hypothetical protein